MTGIAEYGLKLRIWAYSRVDTVRPKYLEMFQKAGINKAHMGIEAGSQNVRREVSKGSFKDVNIREIVKATRASGMNVISNFNFGFPHDRHETMAQTGIGTRALHRNGKHLSLPSSARKPALL